jgi:hypothetical protein
MFPQFRWDTVFEIDPKLPISREVDFKVRRLLKVGFPLPIQNRVEEFRNE